MSWKVFPDPEVAASSAPPPPNRLDGSANRFFAVDLSGSTIGSILKSEVEFVQAAASPSDSAMPWGSSCGIVTPASLMSKSCLGGTSPEKILRNSDAVSHIVASDVWHLLTDGEIYNVETLCATAITTPGVLETPIIFVIVGHKQETPAGINISVGVSFFANATHALIVFKDVTSRELYVLAGKGCFAQGGIAEIIDLGSWDATKVLPNDAAFAEFCAQFEVPSPQTRDGLASQTGVVDLGEEYRAANGGAKVRLNLLLEAGTVDDADLEYLLADSAFGTLSLACKTRGSIGQLRSFLLAHKQEMVTVRFEDVAGAADIVSQLGELGDDEDARKALQARLREAHDQNRKHYVTIQNDLANNSQAQAAKKLNRLIDGALQELAEIEKSTFTAEILSRSSNRAKRAEAVKDSDMDLNAIDLDAPGFRGRCQVCWGENEILSIAVLKEDAAATRTRTASNTDNFALDFPLAAGHFECNDALCSQSVCFQCSTALGDMSIYHQPLACSIPALEFTGFNKTYILQQLYLAFTGRLKMGLPFISQLFMAVLSRTMREKEWANKDLLRWMVENLLNNTPCRETFTEQGKWTTYVGALEWARADFEKELVHSWAMRYPIAGFEQLLELAAVKGIFSAETVAHMRVVKLLHLFASAYLGMLYKALEKSDEAKDGDTLSERKEAVAELTHSTIYTVYNKFNSQNTPTDLQDAMLSLVTSPSVFWDRLVAFFSGDNGDGDNTSSPSDSSPTPASSTPAKDKVREFLGSWSAEAKEMAMPRIQLLAFWLAYTQQQHTRPGTFFTTLADAQPLAARLFKAPTPENKLATSAVAPVLLSIFCSSPSVPASIAEFRTLHQTSMENPFATPWGASVLKCCVPACDEPFIAPEKLPSREIIFGADDTKLQEWIAANIEDIRAARTKHLIKAFGAGKSFDASQSGMPMPTQSPTAPSSMHINLHANIVRAWTTLATKAEKNKVAAAIRNPEGENKAAVDKFVSSVVRRICAQRRGNVFHDLIADDVRRAVPSFVAILEKAVAYKRGDEKGDVGEFEFGGVAPAVGEKMVLELRLGARE